MCYHTNKECFVASQTVLDFLSGCVYDVCDAKQVIIFLYFQRKSSQMGKGEKQMKKVLVACVLCLSMVVAPLTAFAAGDITAMPGSSSADVNATYSGENAPIINANSLSLGSDLAVRFFVRQSAEQSGAVVKAQFGASAVKELTPVSTSIEGASGKVENFNAYSVTKIAPSHMGDEILVDYVVNGVSVGGTKYSAKQYCVTMLSSDDADLRRVCIDILNYCAAAQNYVGYKTDALVNAGLDSYQSEASVSRTLNAVETNVVSGSKVTFKRVAMLLTSTIVPKIRFEASDVSGLTFTVKANGSVVQTITEIGEEDGMYYIALDGLKASNYDDTLTIEGSDGSSMNYSIETFCKNVSEKNSSNTNLCNLLTAMVKYADGVANYIA